MAIATFKQILCKNISENGEDMFGIFDTLICERGKTRFCICVFFDEILEKGEDVDCYYYRIVLRYLGKTRSESRHYRVDSGFFWEKGSENDEINISDSVKYKSTKRGCSGRLNINYGFNANMQGSYEIDLYVKKASEQIDFDMFEKMPVGELDLVSLYPFQIIFQNAEKYDE